MGIFDGTEFEALIPEERRGQSGALPEDQPLRVQREKRKGKWVTVVSGMDTACSTFAEDQKRLFKAAKAKCASGGKATEDGFEVQGDQCDTLVTLLKAEGYKQTKRAGG